MAMKPIETRYKGYRFRSRLEARWAVFFDSLGLEWEYEPEGFVFEDGTRYLPDFFLHGNGHRGPYIEIKGQEPTPDEIKKLTDVCGNLSAYGVLISGSPGAEHVYEIHKEGCVIDSDAELVSVLDVQRRRYEKAIEAARSARFEHGESGARG